MKRFLKSCLSLLLAITIIFSSAYVGLSEIDFSKIKSNGMNLSRVSEFIKALTPDFSVKSQAASSGACGNNLIWTFDNGTLSINGKGNMANYSSSSSPFKGLANIKEVVINEGVTSIGSYAFRDCKNLTSITIPDSVTSIGESAFHNCYRLTSVTIPDNVTSIGVSAFCSCDSLTSITIPDSVTSIGDWAFCSCDRLTSVTIGDSVTSIGGNAFEYCINLTSITIPDSVTSIGKSAFHNCDRLTSVTIGDRVTSIGDCAFNYCTSLISINVDSENAYYTSIDGVLFNKDKTTLVQYPAGKTDTSYVIPDSVTSIGSYAFDDCTNLTSITIPDNVTSIGVCAFSDCTSLTSITIPDSVTSIGQAAFGNCTSFTSIIIPDSVTNIGNTAFYNCTSLTSITIPDSVTRIGNYAFYNCDSLTCVTIGDSVTSIGNYAFENCINLTSITIPDSVTSIRDWAFHNCDSLTSITIGDSVMSIGNYAFKDCNNLTSITIPDSVTSIGDYAFCSCDSITSVTIGDSVTSIGDSAFDYCINLTSITIPDSVTSIGKFAFLYCRNLEYVYYKGTKEQWEEIRILGNNTPLTSAIIHYNSDKQGVSVTELNDNDVIWFKLQDKQAWAEGEVNAIVSGECNVAVAGGQAIYNGKTKTLPTNEFVISKDDLNTGITVTAPDFHTYFIPSAVIDSWKNSTMEEYSIYMTKDTKSGKTYISTVFARNISENDNEYIDVTTENLNLLSGINTDVIITAIEQDSPVKKYWLSQDETHKISDSDGVFSSVDLYSTFDSDKPVYAYAMLENGKTTEPVSVSLKKQVMSDAAAKFINACDSSTISFLGDDGFKITLSDDIPLVGGADITTGMASVPVGVEIENERIRISIGVDIFKNEVNGKSDTEWFNFKNACKSINQSVDEATDKMKTYRNLMIAKRFGTVETEPSKKKNFDGSFLGYIEAYIIDGEIVFKEVSGTVALEFFFNYKQQFLVAGIPAIYAYVKAGAETSAQVTGGRAIPDENLPIEFDLEVSLTPSVKIGGGVGVKDAISAGIWGKGSMPTSYNFTDTHFLLGLQGEIGLEAEFFMLNSEVTLLDGSVNLIDHYFNTQKNLYLRQSKVYQFGSNSIDVFKEGDVSLADRSYLENTSAWLGGQSASTFGLRRTITPESVSVSDLQTSVYKNSQTQLVQFGDTMLMVWIEDCADRDAYNRMRLVYSVYDTETGLWGEPQPVADNGTSDAAPSLATDGENVYVAWQNIDYTVSTADSETVNLLLKNAEIRIAKYNAETGSFEKAITVTDNSTYDYAPKVTVNNGVAEVYWVNSSSVDFREGTLSILKSDFNGTTETVLSGLNYVHNVDSNGTDVSYTMDKDGNTSTTTDVKVYTNGKQVSVDYEGVEASCLYATYAILDGEKTLFYVDDYNLCYIQDGEEKVVFESPRSINGNLQICSDGTKTTVMWLEAGEIGTELYTCSYENGEWSSPIQLTSFSKVLSNVALTYFGGKIYGLFNRTHLEEVTSEVDGSIYYKNGETDLCQLTTEGFTDIYLSLMEIDESQFVCGEDTTFTVLVNNNGTEKVTDISFEITDGNGYSQTIKKTVDLDSGASEFIELTYTVPEIISQTELSVYASVSGDTDESDNVISTDIGTPDLTISDLELKYVEGVYIVSGVLTNNNNVPAENVQLNTYLGEASDANLFMKQIGTIEAKGKYKVEFMLDETLMDFSEKTFYDVTVNISCTNNEKFTDNNQSVTCITKSGIHTHIEGDWIIDKNATCLENGSRHRECTDCGEILETSVVYATGHILSDWITDSKASCTVDGSKHKECTVCEEIIESEVIPKTEHTSSDWIIDEEATVYAAGSKYKECTFCCEFLEDAVIPQLKCATPKLSKVANTTSGVEVTWGAVEGTDGYIVYRRTYNAKTKTWSGWSIIEDDIITSTSYLDKTAKSGTYYRYTIRAINEAGLSGYNTSGIKTYFLSTPKLTSVANATSKVTVKWGKVSGATGYIVYRKTYNASTKTWGGWSRLGTTKSTSYNDTKVKSGTYYRYTVKAYYSEYTSYFDTSGLKIKYLATPELSSVSNGSSKTTVKWGKVSGATGYIVYRKTYNASTKTWGGWSRLGTTKSTSYNDTKVKSGTYYRYTVKAYYSEYASYFNTSGLKIKYLDIPKLVSAKSNSNYVLLEWKEVKGATGYKIYRKTKTTDWIELGTVEGNKKTVFKDYQAVHDIKFTYSVRAYSGNTVSGFDTKGLTHYSRTSILSVLVHGERYGYTSDDVEN